jgi:hypothetical protein
VYLLDRGGHFLNNISQTRTSVGGLNKAILQQKGGGEKGVKRRVYWVMG